MSLAVLQDDNNQGWDNTLLSFIVQFQHSDVLYGHLDFRDKQTWTKQPSNINDNKRLELLKLFCC